MQEKEKLNKLAISVEESLSINIDKALNLDIKDGLLNDEESKLPENVNAENWWMPMTFPC